MIDKMTEREKIAHYMWTLGCTEAEAIELIKDDADVDKGIAKPWDLNAEQIKNQRKLANATTRKSSGTVKRAKKENPDKQNIITCVHDGLASMDGIEGLTCTNAERTVDFTLNGISYTITLTAHRK